MRINTVAVVLIFGFAITCAALFQRIQAEQAAYRLLVQAGTFDRINTPVSFKLPEDMVGKSYQLISEGESVPLQVDGQGNAFFLLDSLSAGASRVYQVEEVTGDELDTQSVIRAIQTNGQVTLSVSDQPVITYRSEKDEMPRPGIPEIFRRGGYIHPVHTPSGIVITDDYPADHLHHHGIWAAWTLTEFQGRNPDFWNMGDSTGTVEPVSLDEMWSGPVHGGVRARHRYVDLSASEPVDVLDETWEVMVYNVFDEGTPYYLFDLVQNQRCASGYPLRLPEYRYGGVGFRGHQQWNGAENAFFLTSEGKDRSNGHATRARWCHIGGYVDGQLAGIAVLDHPDNFRAPQPMRIHPSEPFFNYAPSQAGDWSIEPGDTYMARYRFVVYDGEPDPAMIDRLWNDYAHPPEVQVLAQ